MSEWIVYSKDGLTERCRLKKLEYAGSYMNERTVTATFEYHSEVAFEVFDYIVYRGEKFELEAIPSVKKTSKYHYTYELRFVSLKYELERCEMRDIVPNDNGATYPSPLSFSFTGSVRHLAERIQANLDSLYGKDVWAISVSSDATNEEKNITISQQNCWNALSLVNTSYGLDFSIKGRSITIGGKQSAINHVFKYGKGNGLYEIERVADNGTGIVTKLRAYGSTRNLDYSYPKKPEWSDSVLPVSFILSPLRLMLPSFKLDGKTDYIMANDSVVEEYGIRESSMIYEDIYPTITGAENSNGDSIDEIMAVEEVDDSSPTFVIHLYDLGFDLESHLTTEDAQISMKSGAMQGYTFNISKIEKQEDNTYKVTLGRITTDSSNTGNYDIPNSKWGMSAGDKFVLLNILMPQEYIRAAEQRLLVRAQEYLAEYGKTNFSYNIGLNDKFLKEHENIYDELIEGSKLSVYDEELGIREEVTIQSITIDDYMEDNILPQVKVTLNNKPSASTLERIQGKINELSDSASNSFSTQTELLQQYRKKLDKPFFDRLFAAVDKDGKEIPSTDLSTPISYIKARFSLASLGCLTMYLDDKSFNLPTIYDGLPIDSQTIYWEDIKDGNGVVIGKILKAKTGGGTLGSLTNVGEWADSVADVDRIMVQKKGYDTWEAMDVSGIGSASFENISESGEGNAYTSFELSEDKKSLTLVKGETFALASDLEDKWTTDEELINNWNTAFGWGNHAEAGYALQASLDLVSEKLNNFLEGSDTDSIINKWKELEVFLDGLSQSDKLAEILATKANQSALEETNRILATKWTKDDTKIANWDAAFSWGDHSKAGYAAKSYVDSTFVTIAGNEDVTGIHNFTNGLKIGGKLIDKTKDDVIYIDANLVVRGGITMYGDRDANIPSILNSIPTAGYDDIQARGLIAFNSKHFVINNGVVSAIQGSAGLDVEQLEDYLTSNKYTTEDWVKEYVLDINTGNITAITKQMVIEALGFTPYSSANPNGYITAASIPSALKNPYALTFGSKTYDGSAAKSITASDLGAALSSDLSKYLPLSGGMINGWVNIRNNKSTEGTLQITGVSKKPIIRFEGDVSWGYLGFGGANNPCYYDNSLREYNLIHSGNIGSQSVDNATKLNGQDASYYTPLFNLKPILLTSSDNFDDKREGYYSHINGNNPTNSVGDNTAVLAFRSARGSDGAQLVFDGNTNRILYRRLYAGDWYDWHQIAFTDSNITGNAASATKLSDNTSFTIWGQEFFVNGKPKSVNGVFRSIRDSVGETIIHKALVYPTSPYGLITRSYTDGAISLQAQREANDSERFNLILNPLGGNIGIGTTTPWAKLEILTSTYESAFSIKRNHSEYGAGISFHNNTGKLGVFGIDGSFPAFCFDGLNEARLMVIKTDTGRVGIGTTSPSAKLHVYGGATPIMCESNTSESSIYFIGAGTNSEYRWAIGKGVWGIGGKFGIGEYNTAKTLFVQIDTNGYVGIGVPYKNSPSERLHVNGNILSTGTITTNASLTINGINIRKSQDGVLYLDGNLVVRGGITMYGTDATNTPSILDSLPKASYGADDNNKGIASFDGNYFRVTDGYVSLIADNIGIDQSVLEEILATKDFATKTDLSGYLPLTGGALTGNSDTPLVLLGATDTWIAYRDSNNTFLASIGVKSDKEPYIYHNSVSHKLWHEGNDGSGSGLDSDKLDGREGSGYTYHINGVTTVANKYIKIATLPASSSSTYDSVTISGAIGGWFSYYKADLKITVGIRDGVTFKGYSYPRVGWDIYVNDNGELLIYLPSQFYAWDLSVTCNQAVFDYKVDYTPTDTNFTKMSDSSYIVWFNNNGSVASATKLQTPRTIWGRPFDGTGDVDGTIKINAKEDIFEAIAIHNDWYDTDSVKYTDIRLLSHPSGKRGGVIRVGTGKYGMFNSMSFGFLNGVDNYTPYMFINNQGSVGISTENPLYKLHVYGDVKAENGNFIGNLTGTASYATTAGDAEKFAGVDFATLVSIIPTNTNQLTNGAGFITSSGYSAGVVDYYSSDSKIRIGYQSSSLTASQIDYIAAYSEASNGDIVIKDVDKSTMQSWLGLGTLAYKSSLVASDIPSLDWSKITSGKPTTVSGYGITDAITTSNIGSQSVNYATSAGNADTLDGFHAKGNGLSNLFKWGASAGGNYGGVWCKLASWSATTTETNTDVGFLLHSSFSNVYAHIICRVRKGEYAYLFAAWAYGIDASNIKLCYDDSISNFELWYYGGKAYSVVTAELLYESSRIGSRINAVTMYSNNQGTPSLSNSASLTRLTLQNNVASATKLQTARTIWGQSFDGTADVTGNINLPKSSKIFIKDASNNDVCVSQIYGNDVHFGDGANSKGYNTYIGGNRIIMRYGTSSTWGFVLSETGNIGIGTTYPSYPLDVNGTVCATELLLRRGSDNAANLRIYSPSSSGHLKIENHSGGGNILFTSNVGGKGLVDVMCVYGDKGYVGIGTTSPSAKLHVVGDVKSEGNIIGTNCALCYESNNPYLKLSLNNVNWYVQAYNGYMYLGKSVSKSVRIDLEGNILSTGGVTMQSQRSLKNVVDEIGLSLTELSAIKPTRYTWKDKRDDRIHFGGIADDIQQVLPEVVYKTKEGILTMDYGNAGFAIASSLIKPVIDHEQRIKALEKENELLKQELNRLRA